LQARIIYTLFADSVRSYSRIDRCRSALLAQLTPTITTMLQERIASANLNYPEPRSRPPSQSRLQGAPTGISIIVGAPCRRESLIHYSRTASAPTAALIGQEHLAGAINPNDNNDAAGVDRIREPELSGTTRQAPFTIAPARRTCGLAGRCD